VDECRSAPLGREAHELSLSQGTASLALGYFRTVPPGPEAIFQAESSRIFQRFSKQNQAEFSKPNQAEFSKLKQAE
jgi:hypothetical protein